MAEGLAELSPAQAERLLAADPQAVLLDVREPWEFERVHLPGARLIPLGELASRLAELNPRQTCVVICHHGNRSRQAARLLRSRGFARVFNLQGGIAAWAEQLDPALPRY